MHFITYHLSEHGKEAVRSELIDKLLITERDPMFFLSPMMGVGVLFGVCVDDIRILVAGLFELVLVFFMIRDLLYYYLYK